MKWSMIWFLTAATVFLFEPPKRIDAAPPQQILFYLDESRLITLEFQYTIDGRSVGEVWSDHLDEQFEKIDKNEDGTISGKERDDLPNTRVLRILNQPYTYRAPPAEMDRRGFQDYIETKLEFQPFRVTISQPANRNSRRVSFLGMPNNPDKAAEVLFSLLDRDSDGKLSREEMQSARESLAKRDLDQDETISSAELVPANFGRVFVNQHETRSSSSNETQFLSLGSGSSLRQTASRLTGKYDVKEKDNALSRAEIGMAEKVFKNHDIDGNGKWDFEEIQQFLRSPTADVIVKVQFSTKDNRRKTRITFVHGKELKSDIKNAIGSLNLGSVQMEVSVSPIHGADFEEFFQSQFESIDRDGNGYIDREESRRTTNGNALFQELDRDRDEKLFLEEVNAGLLPVARLVAKQVQLNVTNRGKDLFHILDSNGDKRLSVREHRAMPNRAALWDKDGDGSIALSDVPQQYRLVAKRGNLDMLGTLTGLVVSGPSGRRNPQVTPTNSGPLWFQRMDRNGDGDVSFREFLGTTEDFKKLDRDGDGLIDPGEASKAK